MASLARRWGVSYSWHVLPSGTGSLFHELGGSPAGTFGLAGVWIHDAWGSVTACSNGGEHVVHGRSTGQKESEPSPPLTCSSEGPCVWQVANPLAHPSHRSQRGIYVHHMSAEN